MTRQQRINRMLVVAIYAYVHKIDFEIAISIFSKALEKYEKEERRM